MNDSTRTSLSMAALTGGTVAVWTALPGYTRDARVRVAARGALLAASTLTFMILDTDPAPAPRRDERMAALSRALDDPSERSAIWAAGVIGLVAASALGENVADSVLDRMRARGVAAPRTMLGLGLGALAAGTRLAPAVAHS